jgi:hypothetical protein
MSQPLEPTEDNQILGDYAEALAEAEVRGFTYDPDSLEDLTYDADSIRSFIATGSGSDDGQGNFFHNGL